MSTPDVPEAGRPLAAVVTVSDGVAGGVRDDASGRAVAALLEGSGFEVARRDVVPDEADQIATLLRELSEGGVALVVTTGGTGLGPRDVTPEATRSVIDREAPGLAEEMRAVGRRSTPFASLSRGVAGTLASTLVLNLPGSRRGAVESLSAVLPVLAHAVGLLAGDTAHQPGHGHRPSVHRAAGPSDATRGAGDVDEAAAVRRSAGEDVVVATAVGIEGDPPCRLGQKLLLGSSGAVAGTLGCAEFDAAAGADAPGVLAAGVPATRTYRHDLGTVEVFLEPIRRRPTLVVFSATPVALHLARWAGRVGLDPVLVESRTERVTAEHRSAARVVSSLEEATLDDDTAAVHTDHDAPGVAESVGTLLRSPVRFVGVMGSTRHVGPHLARLRQMGFDQADLARIRTPVGIDIGARTAEEIALSILAGVVADRHDAGAGWLDRRDAGAGR